MAINKTGGKGAFEEPILKKGGFNTPLGNGLAFDQAGTVGPGSNRSVNKAGSNAQHGQSERPYSNPPLDDLDRYYGYGRKG